MKSAQTAFHYFAGKCIQVAGDRQAVYTIPSAGAHGRLQREALNLSEWVISSPTGAYDVPRPLHRAESTHLISTAILSYLSQ